MRINQSNSGVIAARTQRSTNPPRSGRDAEVVPWTRRSVTKRHRQTTAIKFSFTTAKRIITHSATHTRSRTYTDALTGAVFHQHTHTGTGLEQNHPRGEGAMLQNGKQPGWFSLHLYEFWLRYSGIFCDANRCRREARSRAGTCDIFRIIQWAFDIVNSYSCLC